MNYSYVMLYSLQSTFIYIMLNKYVGDLKKNASVMMCRKLKELIL